MTTVIAAIDKDAAARPTLQAGRILAAVYKSDLRIVHVAPEGAIDSTLPADLLSEIGDDRVVYVDGPIADAIVGAIAAEDVVAAVVGARTGRSDGKPVGHIALNVAGRVEKTLGVVPPEAQLAVEGRALRVLVPLDGTEEAALTVYALVRRVANAGVEVVVLHVFTADTVPRFLDHPEHDLPMWAQDFLSRSHIYPECAMRWRTGGVGTGIIDALDTEHVDAVVLGWKGDLGPHRAAVVREVLAKAGVPVVLVPKVAAERALARWAEIDRTAAASGPAATPS